MECMLERCTAELGPHARCYEACKGLVSKNCLAWTTGPGRLGLPRVAHFYSLPAGGIFEAAGCLLDGSVCAACKVKALRLEVVGALRRRGAAWYQCRRYRRGPARQRGDAGLTRPCRLGWPYRARRRRAGLRLPFESRAALMDLLQAALLGVRPSESSWGQTLVRYQLQWARSEAAEAAALVVRYVAAPGVNHLRAAVTVAAPPYSDRSPDALPPQVDFAAARLHIMDWYVHKNSKAFGFLGFRVNQPPDEYGAWLSALPFEKFSSQVQEATFLWSWKYPPSEGDIVNMLTPLWSRRLQ
ncbi:hypothetical protein T492DRAFT_914788 [Pavlovales sp. CCMP2436]|nr:hypothetical protein T492DRAFT_914788 [Pavlovales sp. CCMP2436]